MDTYLPPVLVDIVVSCLPMEDILELDLVVSKQELLKRGGGNNVILYEQELEPFIAGLMLGRTPVGQLCTNKLKQYSPSVRKLIYRNLQSSLSETLDLELRLGNIDFILATLTSHYTEIITQWHIYGRVFRYLLETAFKIRSEKVVMRLLMDFDIVLTQEDYGMAIFADMYEAERIILCRISK